MVSKSRKESISISLVYCIGRKLSCSMTLTTCPAKHLFLMNRIKLLKIVEIHVIFLSDCNGSVFILNDICCIFFLCGSQKAYHFTFVNYTACEVYSVNVFNFIDIGYIFNNAVCRKICKSVVKGIFYGLIVSFTAPVNSPSI